MVPKSTDDDITRLFQENDELGSESSVLLRPIRHLFKHGSPLGDMVSLFVEVPNTVACPFGVVTCTEKNRIIFWPVLPTNADMVAAEGKIGVIDHITLERQSEKSHVTAYAADGLPKRTSAFDIGQQQSWRLCQFDGSGLALWFSMLVRHRVLTEQDVAVQRLVHAPTANEAQRRTEEFVKFASQFGANAVSFAVPPTECEPNYIYFLVYIVIDGSSAVDLTPKILSEGQFSSQVEECPAGMEYPVQPKRFQFHNVDFVVALACPPGRLKQDVVIGLPRPLAPGATAGSP